MLQSEPADNPARCEQTDAEKAPILRLEGNEQSGGGARNPETLQAFS
jgi:hypothetical protein